MCKVAKSYFWFFPLVSPESPEYRELAKEGYLIKKKGKDEPVILNCWNCQPACYDLTNPETYGVLSEF